MGVDNLASNPYSPSRIRNRGQSEILLATNEQTPEAGGPDKVDPLPRPGDPYKVHGWRGNKPDLTIHFVTKDYTYEGFSYGDFERVRLVPSEKPNGGPVLVIRFSGSTITDVKIEGRHLHGLYNWIGLHRLPWIAEHPSPADFADQNAMLVSRISFNEVER